MADHWFAIDKAQHFIACGACQVAAIYMLRRIQMLAPSPRLVHLAALVMTTSIGYIKELGDYLGYWPGAWSNKDLVADVMGGIVGSLVVWVLTERRSRAGLGQHHAHKPPIPIPIDSNV